LHTIHSTPDFVVSRIVILLRYDKSFLRKTLKSQINNMSLPTATTTAVNSDIPDYVTERMQHLIDKKNTLSSQFSEQDVNDLVLFYKENIVFTYLFNMFQLDKKAEHNLMQKIKRRANKLDPNSSGSKATFRVSSEEAESPLPTSPVTEGELRS